MTLRAPLIVVAGVLLLAVAVWPEEGHAQAEQQLVMKVGATRSVTVSNLSRVAVADPSVADIRVGDRDVVEVTGRSAGTTQLRVWKADGQKVTYQVTVSR